MSDSRAASGGVEAAEEATASPMVEGPGLADGQHSAVPPPPSSTGDVDAEAALRDIKAPRIVRLLRAARRHPRRAAAVFLVLALLAAAVSATIVARRPFDPLGTPEGHLLGTLLPKAIVSGPQDRLELVRELGTARARRALGEEGVAATREVLTAAEAVERAGADRTVAVEALLRATTSLDDALRKKSVPVFVDADVLVSQDRARPIVMSYYVEREVTFEAAGARIPAIHLWRLDKVRIKLPFLGFTRPRTPYALVVLDTVETDLVTIVGPSLVDGELFELTADRKAPVDFPWLTPLERRAGDIFRKTLEEERRRPDLARLVALLAERRRLVRKWADTLPGLGLVLHVPERYLPEASYETDLKHRVPRRELDDWERIHGELRSKPMLDAFLILRRRFTGSVERHEVQHRIDYAAGLVPVPGILADILGVKNPLGTVFGSLPARARDELSAHLAQIADGDTPVLDLLLFSRAAFQTHFDAYSYAAWAALVGLGRELGKDVDAQIGGGTVHARQFGRSLELILESPPHEIAAAARRFHEKCFGNELPRAKVARVVEGRAWRH